MGKNATILIVDDIVTNLKLLNDVLTAEGYSVRPANSGELAISSALADKPDLVLLDVRMPGLDGFEVCRRLKANRETELIPVIFISAFDELSDRLKGFEVGCVDFITKPFEPKEVIARIHTQLEINRLSNELAAQTLELKQANLMLQEKTEEIEVQNEELQCQTEELLEQNEEYQTQNDELLSVKKIIEASEKKYRILFETMAQGVVYHDANGVITEVNPAAERIFDMTSNEMKGFKVNEFLGSTVHSDGTHYSAPEHPGIMALKTGKPLLKEVMGLYNHKKGKLIWVNINAIPQFTENHLHPDQVIVTYEDITEIKQAEAELILQAERLKISNDELSRFNQVAVGRELRMIELKREINDLCSKLGEQTRYALDMLDND